MLLIVSLLVSARKPEETVSGNWLSALFLFGYAIFFSFAYTGLTAATGALILFGMVQFTMIVVSVIQGQKPSLLEWSGLVAALSGLVYLVLPGLESPPVSGSVLMALAGIAWGFYTLRGRNSENPIADTTGNFLRTIPFVLVVAVLSYDFIHVSVNGAVYAVLSGAIASGAGYAVWYAALEFLSAARAAVLQLAVPLIAAAGGVLFIGELLTLRFGVASVLILGGIFMTIVRRK
jgi:drug/metabolite transporter (DMT)-like permease